MTRRRTVRAVARLVPQACRLLYDAEPRVFVALLVSMVLSGLAVGPRLIGISLLLEVMTGSSGAAAQDFVLPMLLIAVPTLVVEITSALRPHLERLLNAATASTCQRVILDVTADVEFAEFDDSAFHDALDRARVGSELRPVQVVQGLTALVSASLGIITLLIAVVTSSLVVALLLCVAYLPVLAIQLRSGASYYQIHHRLTAQDRLRTYLVRLLTSKASVAELRFHGGDQELRRRVEADWAERLRQIRQVSRERIRHTLLTGLLALGATVAGAAVLIWLFLTGRLSVATAGVLVVATWELGSALSALSWGLANLVESSMFLGDYLSFDARRRMAASPSRRSGTDLPRLTSSAPVELHRVDFSYPGSESPSLREVSLSVATGQVVALVGPSGAGKSTVVRLLCGLYAPSRGQLRWAGVPVAGPLTEALRTRTAVMMQDFGRYCLSVHDNIALGDSIHGDDTDRLVSVATTAGLAEVVDGLPERYATRLGTEFEGGTDLSVGQWQRLALARTLFASADLVLLDEPTSALDPTTERSFISRLRSSLADKAVLVVSHRYSTVREADLVYVIEDGRVVESGPPGKLMDSDSRYRELFDPERPG